MAPLPWMSIHLSEHHVLLRDHKPTFSDIPGVNEDDEPSLVTFVGDRVKSSNLAALLTKPTAYKRHRTVRLLQGASKAVDLPEIYADCEIQLSGLQQKPLVLPPGRAGVDYVTHKANWFCTSDRKSADFSGYVIANILTPLSSVLCVFADDFGGFPGVASFLASQVVLPAAHSLPASTLPHILVVVNASSTTYDNASASETLLAQILHDVAAKKAYGDTSSALRDFESKYRAVSVHGFVAKASSRQRTTEFKATLASLQKEVYWSRRTGRHLFKARHLTEFSHRMILKLSTDGMLFNFLHYSRAEHFETGQVFNHLIGLLNLMPGQHWLWRVIVPLLASAFFMASYPPESHHFPPENIFTEFFAAPCKQALNQYTRDTDIRSRVISSIKANLEEHFRQLEFDPSSQSALNQHRQCLETLWPHLAEMKSNRSCLSCLMFMPEKVFQCGHAICDVCVRRFGKSTLTAKHSFTIPFCVLCGCDQPRDCRVFQLAPPTAGIRTLCVDGGGVRGVIPLMFLKHLEDELNGLGGTISDCFDYVCGTSAGGLIAMGVFLMRWSPSECLRRFEELATITFKADEQSETLTWSQKLQRLFRVCLQDHRYNLTPIEKAFHTKSGSTTKMFNPLQSDTKVAVTTTSVRENVAGVISNYNYGPRLDTNTYHHIRAAQPQHDMTVSDAAACTSAAPFFFKSKDVVQLDTFQDGGLRYNNPAWLATWESETIWPEKCHIFEAESSKVRLDHFISLGTGTSAPSAYQLGPHSPKLDRFFKRLRSSFEHQLNNEEQWNIFIRCVPAKLRPRFSRLNVPLSGAEPALDDVTAIAQLKSAASKSIECNATVTKAKDTMFASLFYLEVDNIHKTEDGMYRSSVTIYCRLPLGFDDRKRFYHTLLRKHALFVANSRAIPCVSTLPSGFPMFRCTFDLLLKSMTDDLHVRLTGVTSEPTLISGMPTQLEWLVKAQNLEMPFGSIDNRHVEKQLPSTPQKRRASDIS